MNFQDQVPYRIHTGLTVCKLERLDPVVQEQLLLSAILEDVRTELVSHPCHHEEDVGLLMAEVCSRAGSVASSWATKDKDSRELRRLLVQQAALAIQAVKKLEKVIT